MNSMVWFLSIFVFYVGLFPLGALCSNQTVDIGAIFNLDSIDGKVARIAIQAAQDDINSDPAVLGGRVLSVTMHDSNFSGFLGIVGALRFMETDTVALIGPQDSGLAHVLSHVATELKVPMLSFTALDPTLSPLQYPFFVQTAPSDLLQMNAIADVVGYFGWSQVIAVYSDVDQYRNAITTLGDKLAQRRSRISYKAAIPPDQTANQNSVQAQLVKVLQMQSRVIVVHTSCRMGQMIFDVARSLGMMESGFVWIATSWLANVIDSTSPLPPSVSDSIKGVVTLRPHTPDSKRKRYFISRWNKLSNGSIGLNPYGLYAYDTVWMIARAVKLFFDQGNIISFSNDTNLNAIARGTLNVQALTVFDGGDKLLQNILQTNMTGLTGPFQFNSDRSVLYPAYEVLNVNGTVYRQLGYWSNYSGLSILPPEELYSKPANRSGSNQHLNSVVWPGETTIKPRGWVFPDNGRPLKIGVPNTAAYLDIVSIENGTGLAKGYCVDIFLAALKLLPYEVPFEFIPFGDGKVTPSYYELVKQVTDGIFDGAVGDISIVTNRTKIVDFTQPFAKSGLVVVAPVKKLYSSAWAFLRPFTPSMWIVTGSFFLIVGFVVWILEHRINDEFRGPPRAQVVTILWFSFSTMFFAHKEKILSTLGRLVLVAWLFIVLIINSSYTANLTSILTVQQFSSPIKGIDSLISSTGRIGYQVNSFAENYLNEELNIAASRLVPLGSPAEYEDALASGTVAAIIDERPYIELFLSDHCEFSIRGQEFTKGGWGFAFPRDSALAVDLSTAILTLSENGELHRIHDKWLKRKNCDFQNSEPGSYQLQLESFWGLFLICGAACFVALSIYFFKMIRKYWRFFHQQSDSSMRHTSLSSHFQTFLSFADEKSQKCRSKSSRKRGYYELSNENRLRNDRERTETDISPEMHNGNIELH